MELHEGRLHVAVDDGSGNATWKGRRRLDDSSWHLVELRQHGQKIFNVTVTVNDGQLRGQLQVDDLQRNVFDMYGPLYVGGLPSHLLTSRRPHGLTTGQAVSAFIGCLATLTVNSLLYDPADELTMLPAVTAGCRSEQPQWHVTGFSNGGFFYKTVEIVGNYCQSA